MDIIAAQKVIATLNQDFTQLPQEDLYEIEQTLGLASGQVSARRYTLPGDAQAVREEVRQCFLDEAAWCQSYLAPDTAFPPEAVGTTREKLQEARIFWLALATQIRR